MARTVLAVGRGAVRVARQQRDGVESVSSVAPFPKVAWAFLSRLTPQALW